MGFRYKICENLIYMSTDNIFNVASCIVVKTIYIDWNNILSLKTKVD